MNDNTLITNQLLPNTHKSDILVHTKEACENQRITIECGWGEHVEIKHAAYGVYSNGNSCGYKHKEKCVAENSVEVKTLLKFLSFVKISACATFTCIISTISIYIEQGIFGKGHKF